MTESGLNRMLRCLYFQEKEALSAVLCYTFLEDDKRCSVWYNVASLCKMAVEENRAVAFDFQVSFRDNCVGVSSCR